jgi:probable addiction module antidote protein
MRRGQEYTGQRHRNGEEAFEGNGMSKAKTKPFDPAEYLDDSESIAAYMSEALETGDPAFVADALGVVARARGMSEVAKEAGVSRESLYRALRADGNPEFATVLRVVRALGLQLSAAPARR